MPRRSWRDLDRSDRPASPAAQTAPAAFPSQTPGDLEQAAEIAPGSRLSALLQERRQLEDRLRNLTGPPGQAGSGDPRRDAMFHVPSFAERQAEIRQWEAQRERSAETERSVPANRWGPPQIARQPIAEPDAATGLGATGLTPGLLSRLGSGLSPRPDTNLSDQNDVLRDVSINRSRSTREELLDRPRDVSEQIAAAGRPLRQIGDQLVQQDRQLDEIDRKLAAENVSEKERQNIRRAVKSDAIDKVSGIMGRANDAIEAPKKAVAKIDQSWRAREEQISGPMDRFSGYAAERERRLSTETGGSGDLFERMRANRMSALRRRQETRMQERRDERRRERARERGAERRAEES